MTSTYSPSAVKGTERTWAARREDGDACEVTLRYLPMNRLENWDLRYEPGLERLLYIQNLIEED